MVLVFCSFGLLALLAALLMPHLAGGIGVDMALVYLLMAVIAAVFGVLRRPRPRS